MNPVWLVLIIPFSAFLGAMLVAAVGAGATDDFRAAIARRDKMIEELCVQASSVHVGLRVYYKDGIVHREIVVPGSTCRATLHKVF